MEQEAKPDCQKESEKEKRLCRAALTVIPHLNIFVELFYPSNKDCVLPWMAVKVGSGHMRSQP
jgi:hypothetical protein